LHVEHNISFPGHTNALPAELKNTDLFVVSSHCESFSIVLVEALASGVPVVATKCPSGPYEILCGGIYGTLVPVNDVEALADGIYSALTGNAIVPVPESWKSYSLDKVVEQYEEVLYKVLAQ
jgi:glycosyltransferase involved in cell wall biosynthesis